MASAKRAATGHPVALSFAAPRQGPLEFPHPCRVPNILHASIIYDMFMKAILLLLHLLLGVVVSHVAAATAGDALPDSEERWREAVRSAGAAEKPIVVFSRPEPCVTVSKTDPLEAFAAITSHPAMRRRLASVVFVVTASMDDQLPAISLHDPAGNLVVRWAGVPDLETFVKMLTLVEGATEYLVEAYRASRSQRASEAERASALAMLALGDAVRGRGLLESLRTSAAAEDQQLATLWLEQLDSHELKTEPREDVLTELARSGTTDRVRFEAWMAVGNLRSKQARNEEAARAYRRALALAPASYGDAALAALRRTEERTASVLGLGAPGSVVVGRRTIQPRSAGKNAAKVEFRLDGRLVATAKRAPFAASVDFGRIPKRQVLDMTARDSAGNAVHRTSVVVNQRSHEFSVQIVEPSALELSGAVEVAVVAQVPLGRKVESVVVEWNGVPVTRLTSPPYRTRLDVKPGEQGILRAALRLDDGSEVEDVLLANAGAMTLRSEVNLVEVPVYVDRPGLKMQDLIVREGGKQRAVDRIIPAADAPLRVALVLDASRSMAKHMLDVQEAALRFVEENLEDRDRVMMVAFNDAVQMLWPTNDRAQIERAILTIQPRGATALHDAMITALLQIQSTGSRRALVVFSDSLDTSSVFSAGDVAEVARRSGVPVYVLCLAPEIGPQGPRSGRNAVLIPSAHEIVRLARSDLKKLSSSSGGKSFDLQSLDELESIWADIGEDLRRQSLVIYRTKPAGSEWRPLEVALKGGGRLRAPSGVFVAKEREDP